MKQINNSYDPGSLLSTLHEFIHLIFTQAWEEVTIIIPYILQIREWGAEGLTYLVSHNWIMYDTRGEKKDSLDKNLETEF